MTKKILLAFAAICLMVLSAFSYFFFKDSGYYLGRFWLSRAEAAKQNGFPARAAALYEAALSHDPDNTQARLQYGLLLAEAGNVALGEEELKKAVEMSPDDPAAAEALCRLYVGSGRFYEATQVFNLLSGDLAKMKAGVLRPAAPVFSPLPGRYGGETTVDLKKAAGITVYYTTDGTFPTADSPQWEGPRSLPLGEHHFTAVAVTDDGMISAVTTADYYVDDLTALVSFKDPTVEQMTRAALSRYAGHITMADVRSVTALSDRSPSGERIGGAITTFSDLSLFTSLRQLTLSSQPSLPSLADLQAVPSLTSLSLTSCALTDDKAAALSSLTGLQALDLSDNRLTSLIPLSEMTKLRYLKLSENFLSDLTPLVLFTELTYLDLSKNPLGSLSPVGMLGSLTSLSLGDCGLTSGDDLSSLVFLTYLDLSGNRIESLSFLHKCTALETLLIPDNLIANLSPLSELSRLAVLDARDNRVESLRPLRSLTLLRSLNISRNQIRDLTPLSACPALATVFAGGNPIREDDVPVLAGVTITLD